jgi:hypothetical protein
MSEMGWEAPHPLGGARDLSRDDNSVLNVGVVEEALERAAAQSAHAGLVRW